MLTPPLNAPPFISPVLMKVGALIGGWQRKPVNQCKSWSCLKYQAMVGWDMGCWPLGGNSEVEASWVFVWDSLVAGNLRAIMVWIFPKVLSYLCLFKHRAFLMWSQTLSRGVTIYSRLGRPNVKAYQSLLKIISSYHYSEYWVQCFHLIVYGGYGHDSNT